MEIITIVTTILVISFFPLKTAFVAKDLGRKFWPWFLLGLTLPFFSMLILLCLPIKNLPEEKRKRSSITYHEHTKGLYSEINFNPSLKNERQN